MGLTRPIKMSLACRFEMTRQAAFVGAYRLILIVEAQFALADRRNSRQYAVVDFGEACLLSARRLVLVDQRRPHPFVKIVRGHEMLG